MAVTALREYKFEPLDRAANFGGARIVYAGWDGHMMFASPYAWPLPPDLPFAHFVGGPLAQAFSQHPDWAKIDWGGAVWTKNGLPFEPDFDGSIADNGLTHKDSLVFRMPGLAGIEGLGI